MHRSRLRVAIALSVTIGALAGCASGGGTGLLTPTSGDRFFVAGYHPYWTEDAWEDYPFDALDQIYFFELEVGEDGRIADTHGWPGRWSPLLERARSAGVQVVPTVSIHDADAFEGLFRDSRRTLGLVEEVVAIAAATPGLGGIHLDFEVFRPVEQAVRDGYTAFVARLRSRLEAETPDLSLSAFTLAFDDDDVYNERALAELVDFLVIQGYDFHSENEGRAGPVAALEGWGRLNWNTVVDRFLGFGVPARKIVMAVPLYGYEWPVESDLPGAQTHGPGVTIPLVASPGVVPDLPRALDQAELHGMRRDAESGSPYYAFNDGVGWRQGWFEDAASLRAKYEFVRDRGLGGVAVFPLAYGNESLWTDLREAFRLPRQ